jgi:predicted peptidase
MNIEQKVLIPGDQRYTIAVPTGDPDQKPVPLILALHFAGHGMPFYGRILLEQLVVPALHGLGALIVAPDCTASSWSDPQSEADVLTLLDFVLDHYAVNAERILVTGYSMGGNGTWYLAARHPDRFSAAVVMAGWPPAEVTQIGWKVPLYVIHSWDDEFMPLEPTKYTVNSLVEQGAEIEFRILEGITHFETYRYVEPLKSVIPWLDSLWQEKA